MWLNNVNANRIRRLLDVILSLNAKKGDDIGQGIRKQNDFLFQEWTHSFVPKEDIYCNETLGLAIEQ